MNEISHHLWICLGVYLTLITVVQGHFVQYNYKKVTNGQLFNGTLEGKYTERSKIECSLRYEWKQRKTYSSTHLDHRRDSVQGTNYIVNPFFLNLKVSRKTIENLRPQFGGDIIRVTFGKL